MAEQNCLVVDKRLRNRQKEYKHKHKHKHISDKEYQSNVPNCSKCYTILQFT